MNFQKNQNFQGKKTKTGKTQKVEFRQMVEKISTLIKHGDQSNRYIYQLKL